MEGSPAGSCLPLQARERLPRRAEDSRATGVTAKERRRAGERSVCAGKLSRQRREPELRICGRNNYKDIYPVGPLHFSGIPDFTEEGTLVFFSSFPVSYAHSSREDRR
ncbi:hypothetical protein GRJ2_002432000 [Grus japonensis]|uniref:Uncharacterized protein n=1 Tax=Grus japonensis TaxID=30415 RepID=A0ABC9XQF1_GRUJA